MSENRPKFDHSATPNAGRMPPWVRQALAAGEGYAHTARTLHQQQLTTVCEQARCPNRGECWGRGTATFMLLGEICTRACAFCHVATGRPLPPDPAEPQRIATAAQQLGLDYVVLTSVNRDELADGGAGQFAATLRALNSARPGIGLEILTPDFHGSEAAALATIAASVAGRPLIWGHNIETVPRLYRLARRGSDYQRSLALLRQISQLPGVEAKSALMLGLGEEEAEVVEVLEALRAAGVQRIALGQYLRPSRHHLPVREYLPPERFAAYEATAQALGFRWVKAGALVRSSYHAEQ